MKLKLFEGIALLIMDIYIIAMGIMFPGIRETEQYYYIAVVFMTVYGGYDIFTVIKNKLHK